ncbi:MAG: hypothetical protein CMIDDMOC_00767 [Sodalis sp. Fle]|nr:MAG: hypothetical protein CMIDDMOC_00767 [Sodalis sp. Fle]
MYHMDLFRRSAGLSVNLLICKSLMYNFLNSLFGVLVRAKG